VAAHQPAGAFRKPEVAAARELRKPEVEVAGAVPKAGGPPARPVAAAGVFPKAEGAPAFRLSEAPLESREPAAPQTAVRRVCPARVGAVV